jgi:hypothetical protein
MMMTRTLYVGCHCSYQGDEAVANSFKTREAEVLDASTIGTDHTIPLRMLHLRNFLFEFKLLSSTCNCYFDYVVTLNCKHVFYCLSYVCPRGISWEEAGRVRRAFGVVCRRPPGVRRQEKGRRLNQQGCDSCFDCARCFNSKNKPPTICVCT